MFKSFSNGYKLLCKQGSGNDRGKIRSYRVTLERKNCRVGIHSNK